MRYFLGESGGAIIPKKAATYTKNGKIVSQWLRNWVHELLLSGLVLKISITDRLLYGSEEGLSA